MDEKTEAVEEETPITLNEVPMYVVPTTDVVEEIDNGDAMNPYTCSVYVKEVYQYLTELQKKFRPNPRYINLQPQITALNRLYSVDWIVELHRILSQTYHTSLQADTIFISVSLFDRFLSKKVVSVDKIYMLMLGCFFVSSKFEETYYPSIEQLVNFCPDIATKVDLIKMERIILNELRYSLGAPTALTFLKRYAKAAHADSSVGMISRFIAEYSLMDYTLTTTYLPSEIAAASLSHALRIAGRPPWSASLVYYSGLTYEQIYPILIQMQKIIKKAPHEKAHGIYLKYCSSKYLKAASIACAKI
ncbi:putative cyclin B [Monocercomonoides exilis]|uniref:putative cyclin B n=1 Tax=Monocercomonoides exilis TaxID=2049356 RepID=UPI00355AC126|nr:putative cyclin B [Monocercomonoides exilis]|eukprot:MONOS_2812.1-p1 / transcript=MONOS_2812.1 / gene=MONOS_2812 / organism=Monocercomonoides_exilis_PA203 / gene_product=cyclin B / transcript_product=cyclin B / location=Mono_scaffold00060:99163-100250(+) / protein_length=303 / sequence_SO=supercontig / SO=protein_coding / is_pseudo=false